LGEGFEKQFKELAAAWFPEQLWNANANVRHQTKLHSDTVIRAKLGDERNKVTEVIAD
jgi:hypothetical protein